MRAPNILVAGVGNVFFSDDGFGVEVVRVLAKQPAINGVKVADFGIRGMHLAYEIANGYDVVILVDAIHRDGAPGTLYVVEPDVKASVGTPDAHGMELQAVFSMVRTLGVSMPKTIVVGCEPEYVDEGMGFSDSVRQAVPSAVTLVTNLLTRHTKRIAGSPATEAQV